MISCRRVSNVIKEFSPVRSSGCLQISSKLYLAAFDVLVEQVTFLMNFSFSSKVFCRKILEKFVNLFYSFGTQSSNPMQFGWSKTGQQRIV